MIRFAPATVPWLLAHELRILLRGWIKKPRLGLWIVLGLPMVFLAFAGVRVAEVLKDVTFTYPTPLVLVLLDIAVAVLFTLLLSQTLSVATEALYERGDLDLLLSSPMPPRRVLIVRSLAIATSPFLLWSSIVTPILVPLAIFGHWPLLAIYPLIAGLALAASATGILLAMGLFVLIGPRRTRTVAQVLAALVGAGFFLGLQSRNMFPEARFSFGAELDRAAMSGLFDSDSVLSWPALAVLGNPVPLAILLAVFSAFFAAVAHIAGNRFAGDAAIAAGADFGTVRRVRADAPLAAFRGGVFSTMVRKELRLLRRDPVLLSQIFMRALYMVPLTLILFRNAEQNAFAAVAGGSAALTFLASQLAAGFAWATISAEDAPDLVACAPVDPARVRLAKLTAALAPVALLFALPIAGLAVLSPWAGFVAALGVAFGSVSTGLINLWLEKPEQRKNFRRRQSGSLSRLLGELFVGLGAGVTTAMAAGASLWTIVPLVVTLGMLFALYAHRNR